MRIIGTGSAHPTCTVTNDMLAEFLDTSDEWIIERTGIRQRQLIQNENLEDLAATAAFDAIQDAGITAQDIDYIICSNVINEYVTPTLASLVQGKIGADCPAMDLNAACTGFIYALDIAQSFITANRAKNVLIICAEEPTRMVDWKDRRMCVLFGDGAGAVVATQGNQLKSLKVSSKSNSNVLYYKRILEPSPFVQKQGECDTTLKMKGQEVFRMAVTSSIHDLEEVIQQASISKEDISYYVLHQANLRILDMIRHHLGVGTEKFPDNVSKYGNTSSASVPILLDELNRAGKLHNGDLLAMSAFGAGFTSGACILEWCKN